MFILMTHYKRTYHTVPRLGQPNPQGQVHCHRSYYCCWSRSQNRCRSCCYCSCCYCSCCYYHSRYCCCCWHYRQQGSVAHHVTATHQELMGHRGMVAPQVCVAHPVAGGTPEQGTFKSQPKPLTAWYTKILFSLVLFSSFGAVILCQNSVLCRRPVGTTSWPFYLDNCRLGGIYNRM